MNNDYRDALERHGMRVSGQSPDGKLIEIVEVEGHPYMIGSQFHPEFLSRPTRPHPLFLAFLRAAAVKAGVDFRDPPLLYKR